MFDLRLLCPVCFTSVSNWSCRCPKCHYHPDGHNRDSHSRAQEDVALIARSRPTSGEDGAWRRFLPTWLGGSTNRDMSTQ
jgi:hypothetical protein